MLSRKVKHIKLFNGETRTYTCYTKSEADEAGIEYKHWKDCVFKMENLPIWMLSDDDYVVLIYNINARTKNTLVISSAFGRFMIPVHSLKRSDLKIFIFSKDKFLTDTDGYDISKNNTMTKSIISTMAAHGMSSKEIASILATTGREKAIVNTMYYSKEVREMVKEELKQVLANHGFTEDKVVAMMLEAYEIASRQESVKGIMTVVTNAQKLLGMDTVATITEKRELEYKTSSEDLQKLERVKESVKLAETRTRDTE